MMEITDNETICGKYDSPLDHLQNSTIDSKPNVVRCVSAFKLHTKKKPNQNLSDAEIVFVI